MSEHVVPTRVYYTIFGILLLLLMYTMPMGIVGGVYKALRRLRK